MFNSNLFVGFFHEVTRPDRDEYVDIDFEAIKDYEESMFITNTPYSVMRNYIRCNETSYGVRAGCRVLGNMHLQSITC